MLFNTIYSEGTMKLIYCSLFIVSSFPLYGMFDGICIDGADLKKGKFAQVSCKGGSFVNVNFSEADLRATDFEDANLTNANFFRAEINILPLVGQDGKIFPTTNFRNACIKNIKTDGLSLEVIAFIKSQAKE